VPTTAIGASVQSYSLIQDDELRRVAGDLLQKARLRPEEIERRLAQAVDIGYWDRLNPFLTTHRKAPEESPWAAERPTLPEMAAHLREHGYFPAQPAFSRALMEKMVAGVEVLRREGWPPVFSFVYDEFWFTAQCPSVVTLLSSVLGVGYRQNSKIWTYYVPASRATHGWHPHMDNDFEPEGRITIWIALSDATLDNGCIYVVPSDRLPDSLRGRSYASIQSVQKDELNALLQGCRALPAPSGSILGWNHSLIHWGTMSTGTTVPRVSVALEFVGANSPAHKDELPLLDDMPPFRERTRLIAKALLDYQRFEPLVGRYAGLAERLLAG
jgi:hypothetical protein